MKTGGAQISSFYIYGLTLAQHRISCQAISNQQNLVTLANFQDLTLTFSPRTCKLQSKKNQKILKVLSVEKLVFSHCI